MRSQTVRFLALILAIAAVHSPAFSHPGHGHGPLDRVWRDVEGRFEFEARFIQQKENRVHLLTHDGKHVWLSEDDLSPTDREWVRTTQEAINLVNGWVSHTEPADVNNREPSVLTLAWIPVIAGIVFALRPSRRIPTFVLVACGSALSFVPAGCGGQSGNPWRNNIHNLNTIRNRFGHFSNRTKKTELVSVWTTHTFTLNRMRFRVIH